MLPKIDTKQVLAESLIELSRIKPVEKISVNSIVKNCGAGRQTFYNHFKDKYDLIDWIYTSNVNKIFFKYHGTEQWGITLGRTLSFMSKHGKFFESAIKEERQSSFFHSLYKYTKDYYINFFKTNYKENILTEGLLFDIQFNSFGAVNMAREWFIGGMKESPEKMGILIANAMPQSMKKYFKP